MIKRHLPRGHLRLRLQQRNQKRAGIMVRMPAFVGVSEQCVRLEFGSDCAKLRRCALEIAEKLLVRDVEEVRLFNANDACRGQRFTPAKLAILFARADSLPEVGIARRTIGTKDQARCDRSLKQSAAADALIV